MCCCCFGAFIIDVVFFVVVVVVVVLVVVAVVEIVVILVVVVVVVVVNRTTVFLRTITHHVCAICLQRKPEQMVKLHHEIFILTFNTNKDNKQQELQVQSSTFIPLEHAINRL